jgi:hypothetical protein
LRDLRLIERPHVHVAFGGSGCAGDLAVRECSDNARPPTDLSDQHFSVDGTLIEAWASHKSFRPKDGSGDDDDGTNFHGQQRKNDTHASTKADSDHIET